MTRQSANFHPLTSIVLGKAVPAKKNSAAPMSVPAMTIGCSLVSLLLKNPRTVILSQRSS